MEVLVEYDYTGVEDDELTIKPGDIITNVNVVSDGWWEGDLNGKRGVFPDNFVKELRKEEKAKLKDAPKKNPGSHVAEMANKLGKEGLKMGPAPSSGAKVVKRDHSKRKMRAKVAFSYMPENEDELRLEVGETVDIIKQEEEGWWEGSINGKMGMFPSNFVEVVEDENSEEKPTDSDKQDVIPAKKVMGVGLGNIFKDGPINLRRTGDIGNKKTEKVEPTEPKPQRAPAHPKEEKSSSLKKAPPPLPKDPPTLPPRDASEDKKVNGGLDASCSDEAHLDQSCVQSETAASSQPLEVIPEHAASKDGHIVPTLGCLEDSTGSQALDASKYTADEDDEDPLHDADHTSLDSEGCRFLSPTSVEFGESMMFPCSPDNFEVKSPLLEALKASEPNVFDGRRSATSKSSSLSDVPIDHNSLSQARCTPPPKMTFRKRRSKGTPKDSPAFLLQESPPKRVLGSEKPPKKKPRVFESKREVSQAGVSVEETSGGRLLTDIKLTQRSPKDCGQTRSAPVLWGYDTQGGFFIPNSSSPSIKKWVSFGGNSKFIKPNSQSNAKERDLVPLETEAMGTIHAEKVKDSLELNRKKLVTNATGNINSGLENEDRKDEGITEHPSEELNSSSPTNAKENDLLPLETDAQELPPEQPKPFSGNRRQTRFRTWAAHMFAAISPHRKRSKLRKSEGEIDKEDVMPSLEDSIAKNTDVEKVTEGHSKVKPVDVLELVSPDPDQDMDRKSPKSHTHRWPWLFPFTGLRKPTRKVSPMAVIPIDTKDDDNKCDQFLAVSKDEHREVPEEITKPTYLETLQETNRLSPSLRRLSERYSILQPGLEVSRSLELLRAASINSVETTSSEVPQYPLTGTKAASMDDVAISNKPQTLGHFITSNRRSGEQETLESSKRKSVSTGKVMDINKDAFVKEESADKKKPKKKSLFGLGFGTWPRQRGNVGADGESLHHEEKTKQESEEKDKQKKTGIKRKRFSLHRKKDAPPSLNTYKPTGDEVPKEGDEVPKEGDEVPNEETPKKKQSLFGSLRKRLSLRRNVKKTYVVTDPDRWHEGNDVSSKQAPRSRPVKKDRRVTLAGPEDARNVLILYDEPSEECKDEPHLVSELTASDASRRGRRSLEVWRVESSPDRGDRWIANNSSAFAPKLPRKMMLNEATCTQEAAQTHRLKTAQTRVEALLEKYKKTSENKAVKESLIIPQAKEERDSNQQEVLDSVDRFFSYLDEASDRDEVLNKVHVAQQTDEDEEIAEELVSSTLKKIQQEDNDAEEKIAEELVSYTLKNIQPEEKAVFGTSPTKNAPGTEMEDFMAWCLVDVALQKAQFELTTEDPQRSVQKGTTYLDHMLEKEARRRQEGTEVEVCLAKGCQTENCEEVSYEGLNVNLNANPEGPTYYEMMNEEFFNWVTSSHDFKGSTGPGTSQLFTEKDCDESLITNEDVRTFFDTDDGDGHNLTVVRKQPNNNSSPVLRSNSPMLIEGFRTPSRQDKTSELMDIVDAFFGKAPMPVRPEEAEDMQQKLSEFAAYHAEHFSDKSTKSPAAKKVKSTEEGCVTQPLVHPEGSGCEDSHSGSLDNWQLWHSALSQSASKPGAEHEEVIMEEEQVISRSPQTPSSLVMPTVHKCYTVGDDGSGISSEDAVMGPDVPFLDERPESEASSWGFERFHLDSEGSGGRVVAIIRGGLSSCSGSAESGGTFSTDPHTQSLAQNERPHVDWKRAGSFFYGEELAPSKAHLNACPPGRDPSVRPAGSIFLVDSPWKERKTKALRRTWTSSTPENYSKAKRARHSDIEPHRLYSLDSNKAQLLTPKNKSMHEPRERDCGSMWMSPKQEDRPVGVHFGQQLAVTHIVDEDMMSNRKLLRSPNVEDRPVGMHLGQPAHRDGTGATQCPIGSECGCYHHEGGTCCNKTTSTEDLDSFLTGHAPSYDTNSFYSIDSADFSGSTDDFCQP